MDDQPAPTPNDRPAIWPLVITDMQARDAVGRERYGTPLQPHNGRDALADAYAECLDMAVYLRQAIEERTAPPVAESPEVAAAAERRRLWWESTADPEDTYRCPPYTEPQRQRDVITLANAYTTLRSARSGVVGVPGESITRYANGFMEAKNICRDKGWIDCSDDFESLERELRRLLPAPVAKEGS